MPGATPPTSELFAGLSGLRRTGATAAGGDHPLIIALHGGTYSSRYFDLPGYSLLDRAEALGLPILAPDRPGYGGSPALAPEAMTLKGNADFLAQALGSAWTTYRGQARGVVLIGHSIGGAIALMIAAQPLDWPLLGVAVSGVGLRSPPQAGEAWAALPDLPMIDLPAPVKDEVMFGPAGSFTPDMPAASRPADAAVPRTEILDIVTAWEAQVHGVAARIRVPVHYRQAEYDRLWIVDDAEVAGVRDALSSAPRKDVAMVPETGHCMDFHRVGAALQVQQLGFALQCAAAVEPEAG